MVTVYRLHTNELSADLLNSIREVFKDKAVQIVVTDADVLDETEYLLATEANRKSLEKSMREAEEGQVVTMTVEELAAQYGKK